MSNSLPAPAADEASVDRPWLRVLLAVCQAAAILVTWPLWQARSGAAGPPNLPLLDGELWHRLQVSLGEPLLVSLLLAVLWPRIGLPLHALLLAVALALDQLRIQPEFVSVAILLLGTLPGRVPPLIARSHLVSVWLFAGLHKLLSSAYLHETGPELARGVFAGLSDRQAFAMGVGMALSEVGLAVAALWPRARRYAPALAVLLHGGILLSLVVQQWNLAVWPWNVALGIAGFSYLRGWRGPLWKPLWPWNNGSATSSPRAPSREIGWLALSACVMFYPALYYANLCDGYLAWCVYSSNLPEAYLHEDVAADRLDAIAQQPSEEGERLFYRAYTPLNVPFPPAVRLYLQHFRRTSEPGDVLVIDDPRPVSRWQGRARRVFVHQPAGIVERR